MLTFGFLQTLESFENPEIDFWLNQTPEAESKSTSF